MVFLLLGLGALLCLYGFVVVLINAFHESVLWGIGALLLTPVWLVYIALNWSENMKPFLIYLAGIGFMILAAVVAPEAATQVPLVE